MTDTNPPPSDPQHNKQPRVSSRCGVLLIFLLLSIISLAMRLLNLPLNRVIELRYCKEYYQQHEPSVVGPDGNVPEELCKIDGVQKKLAWLEGVIETSLVVCDLVVTIPFGSISDRLGRKIILVLNTLAITVLFAWLLLVGKLDAVFPVEAMIAAPFLSLFGGGDCVLTSTVFAYLTDFAGDIPTRTSYFAYVSSLSYIFSLFGPILASTTMSLNLWLPFYLGIGLLIGAFPIIAFLPQPALHGTSANEPTVDATEETPLVNESMSQDESADTPRVDSSITKGILLELKGILCLVTGRPNFQLLLVTVLVLGIANSNTSVLVLYISKRYGRTFAEVGYLLSIKAAVNVLLLTVVIPILLKAWLPRNSELQVTANFFGAKASLLVSFIGALCLGLAAKLWLAIIAIVIFALGTATTVFILSLVKSPVISAKEDQASGRDFSIVIMVKMIGTLIGTPLMTAIWVQGVAAGGTQLGLPFFVSSILYLVVLATVWNLHVRWSE
ncbi:major facilitator superfamily transporter [Zopfia rhizophila CBS 207.26]|uniref:Major facilitator superfamily transporter n=1 Tax=Zopfia rhizophila CBS 207.26 TaxID=1314779 RepID=A0A6A6D9L6_9PEZI|nr:major facilitator superfamily transporter [Zopfia rhizophila CBS 207.26]